MKFPARGRWQWWAAAAVLALLAGCGNPAIEYNNEVSRIVRNANAVGNALENGVAKHRKDQAALKAIHAEAVEALAAVVAEGKALTPPKAAEADTLHGAFLGYLDVLDHNLRVHFATCLRHAAADETDALDAVNVEMREKYQAALARLQTAQKEFAKANKIRIK